MTKSQCYAEIAQKQREIADYNAKIQKLNSEISCDAPTGALGGNSYRCHYPWPRLAACQVGKVRLHVFEVRRTYRGQVRGRGHCAQPEHAGILQEHVWA